MTHEHTSCVRSNRKYLIYSLLWFFAPVLTLCLVLGTYAIVSFVLTSSNATDTSMFAVTAKILDTVLSFIGLIATICIILSLPMGIYYLSKRRDCLEVYDERSGKGPNSPVPPEVIKFNWGALFFHWIWGVTHHVWIALLAFVPLVNIFIAFYLGFKGNELAWQKNKWESVEKFHQTQRMWVKAFGIIFGIALILMIYVFSQFSSTYRSGLNIRTDIQPGGGCAEDVRQCPDGTEVIRVEPNCEFAECPNGDSNTLTTTDIYTGYTFDYSSMQMSYSFINPWPPELIYSEKPFSCIEQVAEKSTDLDVIAYTNEGIDYCIYVQQDSGAGSTFYKYNFAFALETGTMNIPFEIRFVNCENFDEPSKTACDEEQSALNVIPYVHQIAGSLKK